MQRDLKEQRKKADATKSNPEQVKKLELYLQERKTAFEKASSNAAIYQSEVDTISEEINQRTTGRIKTIDKSINEVVKSIGKIKAEITRINVALKNAERLIFLNV